ncbi:hypothetical protein EJB05_55437, partial [Eragrostis curvula]
MPEAYRYAYDDATSTFTCGGGDTSYAITFCPSSAKASPQQSLRKRLALRSHHPHLQTPVSLLVIVLVVLAVNGVS